MAAWLDAASVCARRALWLPGLVFLTHLVAAMLFRAYDLHPRLDIPMHLAGGFAIAFFIDAATGICVRRGLIPEPGRVTRSVLVFSLVATAAVLWEFGEYASDRFLGTRAQPHLADTLADMVLGMAGGVIFLSTLAVPRRRGAVAAGLRAGRGVRNHPPPRR